MNRILIRHVTFQIGNNISLCLCPRQVCSKSLRISLWRKGSDWAGMMVALSPYLSISWWDVYSRNFNHSTIILYPRRWPLQWDIFSPSQHTDSYKNGSKILSTLANTANIFFLMKAATDEDEHNVCEILSKITVDFPIALHRVLFYQTSVGKLAVVRQLRPQLHVDFESCICRQIAPHVRNVLHIRGSEDSIKMDLSPLPSNSSVDKKFLISIDRIEELLHLTISWSTGLRWHSFPPNCQQLYMFFQFGIKCKQCIIVNLSQLRHCYLWCKFHSVVNLVLVTSYWTKSEGSMIN